MQIQPTSYPAQSYEEKAGPDMLQLYKDSLRELVTQGMPHKEAEKEAETRTRNAGNYTSDDLLYFSYAVARMEAEEEKRRKEEEATLDLRRKVSTYFATRTVPRGTDVLSAQNRELLVKAVEEAPMPEPGPLSARQAAETKKRIIGYLKERGGNVRQNLPIFFGLPKSWGMNEGEFSEFLLHLQSLDELNRHENPALAMWLKRVQDESRKSGKPVQIEKTPQEYLGLFQALVGIA